MTGRRPILGRNGEDTIGVWRDPMEMARSPAGYTVIFTTLIRLRLGCEVTSEALYAHAVSLSLPLPMWPCPRGTRGLWSGSLLVRSGDKNAQGAQSRQAHTTCTCAVLALHRPWAGGCGSSPVTQRPKDHGSQEQPCHVDGLGNVIQVLPVTHQVKLEKGETKALVSPLQGWESLQYTQGTQVRSGTSPWGTQWDPSPVHWDL